MIIDESPTTVGERAEWRDLAERTLLSALREEARADVADEQRIEALAARAAGRRILAETSHDLRAPLQAIGGYAELLELGVHGPVTEPQRIALGRIQDAAHHILDLTTALLDEARVENSATRAIVVDVPVLAALEAASALLAPQASAKGVSLRIEAFADGLSIQAEPRILRRILVNLISNAVKFTAPGGAVTLSSVPEAAIGGVAIRVQDTGRGIPPHELALLFTPFMQFARDPGSRSDGVGLGLAISRDLARGMSGELTAVSDVGVGSTFTLRLPRASATGARG